MPKSGESDHDRLVPAQVEELLRALLGERAEPSPIRWSAAFCASGGKTPMCL
jgi:hypothetical protein